MFYLNCHDSIESFGAKYAKLSANGITTYGGDISTCGADFSTSSNGVSTSGCKVTTQSETFFSYADDISSCGNAFKHGNEMLTPGVDVPRSVRLYIFSQNIHFLPTMNGTP